MMKYWEAGDWADRYVFAQRQAITGLVFGEIEKSANNNSNMPKQLHFQWLGDAERIKQQNFRINQEVEALSHLLEVNGVTFAVVKGQVVATYYERPELRSSGDVDFFVPSEDVEKAQMLISKEWNVEMEKGDSPYLFILNIMVLLSKCISVFFCFTSNRKKTIKIAHFAKFFWLSPGYHLGWMKERLVFHG